jgi:Ni,Fe-hydrogenase maturation factor
MARIDDVVNFNPDYLILIDTCTVKKPPGTISILERESIKEYVPISTHTIPVHIVIDLIVEKLPDLNVFMIGFVPESLEGFKELKLYKEDSLSLEERSNNIDLPFFEMNLTNTVKNEADNLIKIIKNLINSI